MADALIQRMTSITRAGDKHFWSMPPARKLITSSCETTDRPTEVKISHVPSSYQMQGASSLPPSLRKSGGASRTLGGAGRTGDGVGLIERNRHASGGRLAAHG